MDALCLNANNLVLWLLLSKGNKPSMFFDTYRFFEDSAYSCVCHRRCFVDCHCGIDSGGVQAEG